MMLHAGPSNALSKGQPLAHAPSTACDGNNLKLQKVIVQYFSVRSVLVMSVVGGFLYPRFTLVGGDGVRLRRSGDALSFC
jgi:hypothetical protein